MSKSPYGLATPLSFEVHQLSTGPSAIVYDARGMAIDTHLFEEQAADIVRAVNAHDDLLTALKDLVDDLEIRSTNGVVDCSHGVYCSAVAAISKAEGRA